MADSKKGKEPVQRPPRPPRPSMGDRARQGLTEGALAHQQNVSTQLSETMNKTARPIAVSLIDPSPYQNRLEFSDEAIKKLADTIDESGLISPIEVRPKSDGRFELVVGECRLRAHKLLHKTMITAIVSNLTDEESSTRALVENNSRNDPNDYEVYLGIVRHRERFGAKQDDHVTFGISRSNYFRQMSFDILPDSVHTLLRSSPRLLTGATVDAMKSYQAELLKEKKTDSATIEKTIKKVVQHSIDNKISKITNLAAEVEKELFPKEFRSKPKELETSPGNQVGTMLKSGKVLQVKLKLEHLDDEKIEKLEKFVLQLCAG